MEAYITKVEKRLPLFDYIRIFATQLTELVAAYKKTHSLPWLLQEWESNVVIGGSCVLQLHGLNTWEPQDLDVVIFQPTEHQCLLIENELGFEPTLDYQRQQDIGISEEEVRSWKKHKGKFTMNLIYAFNEPVPANLMWVRADEMWFQCNTIRNIIDAKLSYAQGKDKNFLRRKDMQHLTILKNENFNVL